MRERTLPIAHDAASSSLRPVTAQSIYQALSAYLARLLRTAGDYFAAGGPMS